MRPRQAETVVRTIRDTLHPPSVVFSDTEYVSSIEDLLALGSIFNFNEQFFVIISECAQYCLLVYDDDNDDCFRLSKHFENDWSQMDPK